MSSRAVIVQGVGGHVCLLSHAGHEIRHEVVTCGTTDADDLGFGPPSAGVYVWEGTFALQDYPNDDRTKPEGVYRAPTPEEWAAIARGECPWPDDEADDAQRDAIGLRATEPRFG